MNHKNSGLVNGTNGSAQLTIENGEAQQKYKELEQKIEKLNKLAQSSSISIPATATVKEETKNGYEQVKYTWKKGDFSYTSRWHTRTPNAPKEQGESWVVQRDKAGIGYGKNARPAKHEILVGKNKWVSKKEWQDAIRARKNGTATKHQKELLDNGHWNPKK